MKWTMRNMFAACLITGLCLAAAESHAAVLYNTSFEDAGTTAAYAEHWEFNNPDTHGGVWGSASRESWRAHEGTWEATIRGSWSGNDFGGWWQELAASEGEVYVAQAWFYADNSWTADSQTLQIEFFDASNTLIGVPVSISLNGVNETWTSYTVQGEAPVNTAWARFVVQASGAGADGALQFDDIYFGTAVPEPTTFGLLLLGSFLLNHLLRHRRRNA